MRRLIFFNIFFLITFSLVSFGQSPKAPLSRVINVPGTTQIAPSFSADGRNMVFTTTANVKSELLVHYASLNSAGRWGQPEPIDVINRSRKINHLGGYTLSYDGQFIFFTSRKSYGIGNYDIWYVEKSGKGWSSPKNLAKPVNSAKNDGCPSISADGKHLYFVRCDEMDQKEGKGCVLMVSARLNSDRWGEPQALPAHVNNGNILSPKILADNQTLIYAKGEGEKIDLYQTKKSDAGWSKPLALDYINTPSDERFVSVPAQGEVIYYSAKFKGSYDIIKAKIPKELQPEKVVLLQGEVTDAATGEPMEGFIQIHDMMTRELVQYHRTSSENGSFEFFIPGGKVYDFSVASLDPGYVYFSEQMDLRELEKSRRQKLSVDLKTLQPDLIFDLQQLEFDNDSTLSQASAMELDRLFKLLKYNPTTRIEIRVHRESWDPDTTEVYFYVSEEEIAPIDSTVIDEDQAFTLLPPAPDPTELRAKAIADYLISRGVPEYLLEIKGYADSQPVAPNDTEENRLLNRRVEIRILQMM